MLPCFVQAFPPIDNWLRNQPHPHLKKNSTDKILHPTVTYIFICCSSSYCVCKVSFIFSYYKHWCTTDTQAHHSFCLEKFLTTKKRIGYSKLFVKRMKQLSKNYNILLSEVLFVKIKVCIYLIINLLQPIHDCRHAWRIEVHTSPVCAVLKCLHWNVADWYSVCVCVCCISRC